MLERFGKFVLSYPRAILALVIFLGLLSIYPALQIRTDFNLEGFYPDDDPVIYDYQFLEQEFGRDDNAMLIGFQTDSLLTRRVLSDLHSITESLKDVQYVESVLSIWDSRQILADDDLLKFNPYLTPDGLDTLNLQFLKRELTSDPLVKNYLLNEEGNATSIVILINEEENTYENRNRMIDEIDQILNAYGSQYEFHISGIPYFRNQYVNMLNDELVIYISLSSVLIILLLWYIYRTFWGVIFPMIIVWTTLIMTVAIIYLTGGYLEIMSTTIAPILLCVGVADAVHMLSKYDDAREAGFGKRPSILEMLKTLGSATFLTSITTAIGFASLISSSVIPMKRFGIYTAAGVLLAYLITILFLPAALRRSRKKRVVDEKSGSFYPFIKKWLSRLSAFTRKRYTGILVASVLITGIFAIGIRYLDVNGQVFDDIDEDTELMRDSRFFSDNISPQFPLEFVINTNEPDAALSAELLKRVQALEDSLLQYPEIHRVSGLHTVIGEMHRALTGNDSANLPEDDDQLAQYLLLLEINNPDVLTRFINFDYSALRVTSFTEDAGSKRINEIREELRTTLNSLIPEHEVIITGTTILNADLTDKIVYSLSWSILLALSAITLVMVYMFRDFRMIVIALVPNLLPLLIVAGLMGYIGTDIKPSTAVIFTIALGIAVDDSIHYLARLRIELIERKALLPSLAATTIRTGRAIVVTSLILIAGFGTLVTSDFSSTAMMGLLVCATIFSAVLADLFLLPSLFYWFKPNLSMLKDPDATSPHPQSSGELKP